MSYDLTEDGPSGAHVRRAYIAPFMDLVPEIDASAFIAPTAAIIGAVRRREQLDLASGNASR